MPLSFTPPSIGLRIRDIRYACALSLALLMVSAAPAAANPFDKLAGYWRGEGTVSPGNGQTERVICRVTYMVEGAAVTQNMRCAGTDYKFSTKADLTYGDGQIEGSWSETIYSAEGGVTGTATDDAIQASISGKKFSGRMDIAISGSSHSIRISHHDPRTGQFFPVASVELSR